MRLDPVIEPLCPFVWHVMDMKSGTVADIWNECCYSLWQVIDGVLVVEQGGRRLRVGPGRTCLTEPGGIVHHGRGGWSNRLVFDLCYRRRIRRGLEVSGVGFDEDRSPQPPWQALFGSPLPLPLTGPGEEHAHRLIERIRHSYWIDDVHRLRAGSLLLDFLLELAYGPASPIEQPLPLVTRLTDLIQHNLKTGITLAGLAEKLGMSRSTLERRLRRATGISAGELVTRTRLEVATRFLREGRRGRSVTVRHVAERCGFRGTSAFCQWFRRHTGSSPRRWRELQMGVAPDP